MALPDDCKDGDYVLRRENGGGIWMATAPCYVDPYMSPVGYGRTEQEAIDDLIRQPMFQSFLERSGDRPPTLAHFTIDRRPPGEVWTERKHEAMRIAHEIGVPSESR
jgi:hypothetical protein